MRLTRIFYRLGLALCLCTSAFGYNLSSLNLGYSSFADAIPLAPGYGWYVVQRVTGYNTQVFTNGQGGRLNGVPSPSYNPVGTITQITYIAKSTTAFNAHVGFSTTIPTTLAFNLQTPNSLGLKANGGGFNNSSISPFLQWEPVMLHGRPFWYNRLQLDNYFPTGKYSKNDQLNPGAPHFSIEPYWSTTVLITPSWEFSSRLYDIWSGTNPYTHIQAGNAILDDFATSYKKDKLRLGISGYFLKQLVNSKGNPAENSKEQVLGIGPGATFYFTKQSCITVNYYTESHVENRTKGTRAVLSFTHAFADLT